MHDAAAMERIQQKYAALDPVMDERLRRQWAAVEANTLGWGGVSLVARATGLARNTITHGVREIEERKREPNAPVPVRLRKAGAGPKRLTEKDPTLLQA